MNAVLLLRNWGHPYYALLWYMYLLVYAAGTPLHSFLFEVF